MNKYFLCWLLFTSSMATLCAQQTSNAGNRFGIPASVEFNQQFTIDLGNSNQLQIQVTDAADLQRISNIDSIVQLFLKDMALLQDSLNDPLNTKHINYVADAFNRKKIYFSQSPPNGAAYLLDGGELALLRTGQDTIIISGEVLQPPAATQRLPTNIKRFYQLSFFLNDYKDLQQLSGDALSAKIETIIQNKNSKWTKDRTLNQWGLKSDPAITAPGPAGFAGNKGDYLEISGNVSIQNYKNYFVPSFGIGASVNLRNPNNKITTRFGLSWEPNFIFAKDDNNKLKSFRNDFLSLSYGRESAKEENSKAFAVQSSFNLAYLIRRQGDFFDKNSFRLGIGRILTKRTAIEPLLYFNNFFKGVTPGIRLTQFF